MLGASSNTRCITFDNTNSKALSCIEILKQPLYSLRLNSNGENIALIAFTATFSFGSNSNASGVGIKP